MENIVHGTRGEEKLSNRRMMKNRVYEDFKNVEEAKKK